MTTITTSAELGQDRIQQVPVDDIYPSPENDRLYRPIDPTDPEFVNLTKSISDNGILEPLVVTSDGWLLSGHRRYAAARLVGLKTVPCRVKAISRQDDHDGFLVRLREYNRQREKSLDEKLREAVVETTVEDAYDNLVKHRKRKAEVETDTLEMGDTKRRARISRAKGPFLNAIADVLDTRQRFWPVSDRQIHYALLNNPPLIHASKPDSTYTNTLQSYKALTDLLTRARLTGDIPMKAIADETRPVETWNVHHSVSTFLRSEFDNLLKGYYRDLQQSQPNHIEIVGEKNTILSIIQPVASEFCIPLTIGRGFCSLPPRADMADRYRRSGRETLVLLFLSDHDPEGEQIPASFARSMRDDFGIRDIKPIKVALTADQVAKFDVPGQMTAKEGSANRKRFVAKHGEVVHELEALPPKVLQQLLHDAVVSVLDVNLYNQEIAREKQEAKHLDQARQRVKAALAGMVEGAR